MKLQPERNTEGYLINPDDWTEDMAAELADEEGIELNDSHWQVLKFMRDYYYENNIAPDVRHVAHYLAIENKLDKKDAKKQIFELFPYGYVKQACKISGMKKPLAWSTG